MARLIGPDLIALQAEGLAAAERVRSGRPGRPVAQRTPAAAIVATAPAFAVRRPLGPRAGASGSGVGPWSGCDDAQGLHDRRAKEGGEILSPPPAPSGSPSPSFGDAVVAPEVPHASAR